MKETKTAKAGSDCPTLLHYLARVLLRANSRIIVFVEELPHVEAAARGTREAHPTDVANFRSSISADSFSIRRIRCKWARSGQGGDQISEADQVHRRK